MLDAGKKFCTLSQHLKFKEPQSSCVDYSQSSTMGFGGVDH